MKPRELDIINSFNEEFDGTELQEEKPTCNYCGGEYGKGSHNSCEQNYIEG